jgi:hypothetical protein
LNGLQSPEAIEPGGNASRIICESLGLLVRRTPSLKEWDAIKGRGDRLSLNESVMLVAGFRHIPGCLIYLLRQGNYTRNHLP